ncbi:hypothetical protein QZH41_011200, partial [Actinostola sp. cb2023]
DRHGEGHFLPAMDDSQDYKLISGSEKDGKTTLKFSRKLDTCDKNDLKIEDGTTRVIFSYSNEDPISLNQMKIHSYKSSRSMLLLSYGKKSQPDPSWEKMEFLMNNITIPSRKTSYTCQAFRMPNLGGKRHIVRFEPVIQPGNEGFAHHLVVYECKDALPGHLLNRTVECTDFANMPSEVMQCKSKGDMIASWGIGAGAFHYPEHVGFPVGMNDSGGTVIVEIHYDNPEIIKKRNDNSGVRFYYTSKLRQYDAGSLTVGADSVTWMVIPPKQQEWIVSAYCKKECTQKWCSGVMVYWCTGVLVYWCTGVLVYWCTGVLVYWCTGVLVYWCTGVLVYWCTGVLVYWCTGVLVYWCTGVLVYWCTGVLVYWCTGVLVYWCTGVLVYWCTGVLVYWCTGVLVYWCTGVLVYWCTGVLVYWCTGVLVYRSGVSLESSILPGKGIKIFSAFLHTHLAGRGIWTKHIRDGVQLPDIAGDNYYDFNFQEVQSLPKEVHFKPGDEMIQQCKYNTLDRVNATFGGLETTNEMCLNLLMYYPRIPSLKLCTSNSLIGPYKFLEKYFPYLKPYSHLWYNPLYSGNPKWTDQMVKDLKEFYKNDHKITTDCLKGNYSNINYWLKPSNLADKVIIKQPYVPPPSRCDVQSSSQILQAGVLSFATSWMLWTAV